MAKLLTPVNDGNELAQLLRERYGFRTEVLLNADRNQILTALGNYRRTLPAASNLLIYYAGHGYHDRDADEAYWLPVDARPDNTANWISADDITRNARAIPSSHVLVISDSCYAGYIVAQRSGNAGINPESRGVLLAKLLASKSRNLMSSGGDEPVSDTGAPGHSVFAAALLESLRQIEDDNFSGNDLFDRFIQPQVGGKSNQLPQYSWIRDSGHEYGDFVFSRRSSANGPATESAPLGATSKDLVATNTRSRATNSAWAVGDNGTILHTEDGGVSWKSQSSGIQDYLLSVVFATPQLGWAAGAYGIIVHTEDGGVTWRPQSSGIRHDLYSVFFATPHSGWAVRNRSKQ